MQPNSFKSKNRDQQIGEKKETHLYKQRQIPPEPEATGLFWISGATWPRIDIVLADSNCLYCELNFVKQKNGWRPKKQVENSVNGEIRGFGDRKNGGKPRILTWRM